MGQHPFGSSENELAHEIDRLLRQLPHAERPVHAAPTVRRPGPAHGSATTPSAPRISGAIAASSMQRSIERSTQRAAFMELAGVWSRALLAATLGASLMLWPYANDCGPLLHFYLVAIGAVLVAAGWSGVTAWRARVASAHALSLVVAFWGIVLAAEEILPRVGYASAAAEWTCAAPSVR